MSNVTLIRGDGIGPEVSDAARAVIDATNPGITWDVYDAGLLTVESQGTPLPDEVIESIRKNKVALKGPITTPVGKGFRSVNVALRKELELYANVRPAKSYKGIETRYQNVDLITIRENTEGLYCGIEHRAGEDAAESIRLITRKSSERIARYAFELAKRGGRKKITVLHKANILKLTDGLFLECVRNVAQDYPGIELDDLIIDAACMRLVTDPEHFDVLLATNLFGDIVSDLCSGLIGGLGLTIGSNIGAKAALFEPVHGSAPDIAGKNIANPTACILAGASMLRHMGMSEKAGMIEKAVEKIYAQNQYKTRDLGGNTSTSEFADRLIDMMK